MPELSSFQYNVVYNLMSLTVAAMGAASIFFFFAPAVDRKFRPAMVVTGLVTSIACYHYYRILGSFEAAYTLSGAGYVATGTPFNDFYRYADWLLTVPLLMVELVIVLRLSREATNSLLPKLVIATLAMIALGYPGEAALTTASSAKWAWFAASMAPFLYVMYVLFGELGRSLDRQPGRVKELVGKARTLVVVTWSFYPIAYVIGALGAGSAGGQVGLQVGYTIADITAKALFGVVIYFIARAKTEAEAPSTEAVPQAA